MTDSDLQQSAVVEPAPGLSQVERVVDTFVAPTKTFEDIRDRSRSWWLPFLLLLVVGTALWTSVTVKVTWSQVFDNGLRIAPAQAEKLQSLPPDQLAKMRPGQVMGGEIFWALAPVLYIILGFIMAGIHLGTINFIFGGKANYWKCFAVFWYAGLPLLIKLLLGTILLWVGMDAESFLPSNPGPTNLGFFITPPAVSSGLWALMVALDITAIWSLVIQSQGLAIIANVKRSAGYITVFGWFAIFLLLQIGMSVAFS